MNKYIKKNLLKSHSKVAIVLVLVLFVASSVSPAQTISMGNETEEIGVSQNNENNPPVLIEKGPIQESILYYDGSIIELQTEIVSQLISDSDPTVMTLEDLKAIVYSRRESFENEQKIVVVNNNNLRSGLNIVFNTDGSVPGDAITALGDCEAYLESFFGDSITVSVNVAFANLPSGILGQTSVYYAGSVSWINSRNGLQNDMDSDDVIQNWLPSGSTIPVRYNDDSSTVTNENRAFWSKANYKATIGAVSGIAGAITLNTDYTWDYDPSNGVSGFSFNDVMLHEVGHALGFVSYAEDWLQGDNDMYTLDIFRFRRDDGSNDYNPDNYEEFQTTPRLVDYNKDSVSDIIDAEYRMSDGDPYQASHFYYTSNALMAPAIGSGETNYPNYMINADIDMFDAIGWDYPLFPNDPPYTPSTPTGSTPVPSSYAHEYSTSTTDPDGNQVYYMWNWGGEISDWIGPYDSGIPVTESHTWNHYGVYEVKVRAKDTYNDVSDWSNSLSVRVVIPGDLNIDGNVSLDDLAALLANYGMTSGATYEDGDIDGNGDVSLSDLAALLGYYGSTEGITETLLQENFEDGIMPPEGWTLINTQDPPYTWHIVDSTDADVGVHSGYYAAAVKRYHISDQDEKLISFELDLSGYNDVALEFWAASWTWNPGATVKVIVKGDGIDDEIWDMIQDEVWETVEYRNVTLDLSDYIGEIITVSWNYVGMQGWHFGLDDILVYAG